MNPTHKGRILRRLKRAVEAEERVEQALEESQEVEKSIQKYTPERLQANPEDYPEYFVEVHKARDAYEKAKWCASDCWKTWTLVARTQERIPWTNLPAPRRTPTGRAAIAAGLLNTAKARLVQNSADRAERAFQRVEQFSNEEVRLGIITYKEPVPRVNNKRKLPAHWADRLNEKRFKKGTYGKPDWTDNDDIPSEYGIIGKGDGPWEFTEWIKEPTKGSSVSPWSQSNNHDSEIADVSLAVLISAIEAH